MDFSVIVVKVRLKMRLSKLEVALLFISPAVQLLFQWLRYCIISNWDQLLRVWHHLKLINLSPFLNPK